MNNKNTDKEPKDKRPNNKKKKRAKSKANLNKGKVKDILELLDIKDTEIDYDTTKNKEETKQKQYSNINNKKEQKKDEKNNIINKEINFEIKNLNDTNNNTINEKKMKRK